VRVNTSLDWEGVRAELMAQINSISYNNDLRKMIKAVDSMVADLSKFEVDARRTRNTGHCTNKVLQINEAVENIEKWIVMAILLE